jgi:Spy/CpxP family protein refolding chaperone
MKKKLLIVSLVLLFVINITALATLSYNRWFKPAPLSDSPGDQPESLQKLKTEISLTPHQSQTLQGFRLSLERELESIRQQISEKRNALLEEARNPSPDMNRIDSLVEEIGALQTQIQKKSVRNLLKDKRILTPRQQERYFSLFEQHMQGQGWRRRMRGKGRRGPRWLRDDHQ